ncbi:KRAB-A domain-containing protein 2-like [Aphis craccivora]|uniref:KRAB-A domain-containing protein 2-like n=1 Tax=Aphis craccivora TaxID=307492 RepID=A0A6G0ZMT3_APHCR|nr:KRAB-A domain-containing protein 2-like [Aphis craccivora]
MKYFQKQVERIMTQSNKKYQKLKIRKTVHVSIGTLYDNIACRSSNYVRIGNCFLKHKYAKFQIVPCKEFFFDLETHLKPFRERDNTSRNGRLSKLLSNSPMSTQDE